MKKDQMLCFTLKVLLLISKKTFSAFVKRFLKPNDNCLQRLVSKNDFSERGQVIENGGLSDHPGNFLLRQPSDLLSQLSQDEAC